MIFRAYTMGLATVFLLTGAGVVSNAAGDAADPSAPQAEPAEQFPGQAAYRAALARAETTCIAEITKARAAYIAAIRDLQMRARMLPERAAALNAEVKRIEALPRPICNAEPAVVAQARPENQPPDNGDHEPFPGYAAYRASLSRSQATYIEAVMKARADYITAIRDLQMRASMLPEQSQAMDAEVKRIESLARPFVDAEPTPARPQEPTPR